MNFDDLLGLLVFLGIVIISSVFRGLKEMKKKEEEKSPKVPSQPVEKEFKEPLPIPKRKVIIRKETEPVFPPPPVFTPIPETIETKEDMFEKVEEGEKQVIIKFDKRVDEESHEGPIHKEKPPIKIEKKDKYIIKVKPQKQEEKPSMVKIQKVAVSAPMQRTSASHQVYPPISLRGNIGNIPKLQWAVIMTEILGTPKALRRDLFFE